MNASPFANADLLHAGGDLDEAVAAYTQALAHYSWVAEGWYGLGCAQLARGATAEARTALARAVELAPQDGKARWMLGKASFELGHVDAAVATFADAASRDPGCAHAAVESIACIIPGAPGATAADVAAARRRWAAALPAPRPRPSGPRRAGKLRVGYLSSFFGRENWMKPVYALLNRHDRDRFALHLLSDGSLPAPECGWEDHDEDHVHDLRGVANEEAAAIVAGLELDVLVDLNGYSALGRLPLVACRPARHVVAWFNSFATTGLEAVDWIVGDGAVLPTGEEVQYGERVHRVPGTYLAFTVGYDVPEVAPAPLSRSGRLTFGCLGSQYKLTDAVLAAWARILAEAPATALHLRNAALTDAGNRADLLARLAAFGVDPARVTLAGRAPHRAFLADYASLDVALDTFPYNGGTTTTEALWQGVPVLAIAGDRWAGRTSLSLLRAAGFADWVAPDVDAYVARAVALAHDPATPAMLAALRAGMRERLGASAACDADGLRVAMESFYERIALVTEPEAG